MVSKPNLTRPDGSPAKPGAKTPMSTQKSRQAGHAIGPVRSIEKKARHLFRCEAFFIHFFAHPLLVLLTGGQMLENDFDFIFYLPLHISAGVFVARDALTKNRQPR